MEKERVRRKKGKRIFLCVFLSMVLLIIIMQLDTNVIMNDVRDAFLSEDYYVREDYYNDCPEAYSDPNINYVIYKEYSYESLGSNYLNKKFNKCSSIDPSQAGLEIVIDLKINRFFAIHNFFDGYVWFTYFVYYRDSDGNHLSGAGATYSHPVEMQIHRENGRWQVVSIWEHP